MYDIGDKVVYPQHGAGTIVDEEEMDFLGEMRKYFILHIPIDDIRVMIPVDSMEESGIRRILSVEEMDEIIYVLKENKTKMSANWNHRYRNNMDKIKGGNIEEIAEVARNLEILDSEKSLSTGERKMLNSAKQILISEMMLVYDIEFSEAESKLMDAIHL
ncbi:MAG: CarD family transcriptional regulator [Tissierellia bacterium]|nr:CarD family transcriptional regulator [Tissierellia bacterium]